MSIVVVRVSVVCRLLLIVVRSLLLVVVGCCCIFVLFGVCCLLLFVLVFFGLTFVVEVCCFVLFVWYLLFYVYCCVLSLGNCVLFVVCRCSCWRLFVVIGSL